MKHYSIDGFMKLLNNNFLQPYFKLNQPEGVISSELHLPFGSDIMNESLQYIHNAVHICDTPDVDFSLRIG